MCWFYCLCLRLLYESGLHTSLDLEDRRNRLDVHFSTLTAIASSSNICDLLQHQSKLYFQISFKSTEKSLSWSSCVRAIFRKRVVPVLYQSCIITISKVGQHCAAILIFQALSWIKSWRSWFQHIMITNKHFVGSNIQKDPIKGNTLLHKEKHWLVNK